MNAKTVARFLPRFLLSTSVRANGAPPPRQPFYSGIMFGQQLNERFRNRLSSAFLDKQPLA